MPSEFLIEQMQWREALDDDPSSEAVGQLHVLVVAKQSQLLNDLQQQIDQENNLSKAASSVRQLMFVEKFLQTLSNFLPPLVV
jgi:molecular chaperone HscB